MGWITVTRELVEDRGYTSHFQRRLCSCCATFGKKIVCRFLFPSHCTGQQQQVVKRGTCNTYQVSATYELVVHPSPGRDLALQSWDTCSRCFFLYLRDLISRHTMTPLRETTDSVPRQGQLSRAWAGKRRDFREGQGLCH